MLNLFNKKKSEGTLTKFKITGMHCSSCAMTIDGELEEQPGVISSQTSYAKGLTEVEYDKVKISVEEIMKVIKSLNYMAKEVPTSN